ncbi:MAG: hypothetical protein J6V99_04875, partial [Neisseriaceae bacterium]|nr:hypothetical protein [Neisseriaceae bacterium]
MENTFTATELLTYANLQIAAETLYGKLKAPAGNPSDLTANGKAELTVKNLKDGNMHSSLFSETQAKEFVENWEIVSHLPNTSSGFSGTLFRVKAENGIPNTNLKNGDLVLSFRSTEFVEDQLRDSIATNTLEITEVGWAMGQISDMEEWFTALKEEGIIGKDQKINVTGYSLGGHLATAFHILHSDQIDKTFTFNGAGVGSVGGDEMTTATELNMMISTFDNYNQYGVGHLLTSDVLDFYNQIRISLSDAFDAVKNSDTISQYIEALNDAKLVAQMESMRLHGDSYLGKDARYIALCEKQVGRIADAIDRLLEIANEYQRICNIQFPNGTKPNTTIIDHVEALNFDYQMAVLFTAETHQTKAYIFTGADEVLYNHLDIVDPDVNIYNIKADTYPSMTAVSQKHYGKEINVAIEDQPLFRGNELNHVIVDSVNGLGGRVKLHADAETSAFGDTHSLVLIVDSLSVQSLFEQLDSSLSNAEFNEILKLATNQCGVLDSENTHTGKISTALIGTGAMLGGVVGASAGAVIASIVTDSEQVQKAQDTGETRQGLAEGDALENMVNSLACMLGVQLDKELKGNPNGNTWHEMADDVEHGFTGRESLHTAIKQIAETIENNGLTDQFTVQSCLRLKKSGVPFDSNGLRDDFDAQNNFADFLAIYTLSPFTLTASDQDALEDYWKGNDKIAEIYDQWQKDKDAVENGEERIYFSDTYIAWRSQMLERKMVADYKNEDYKDAINAYNYYKDNTTQTELGEDATEKSKIIFGKDEDKSETLTGGNKSDYLFGGQGDDTLIGGKGADYLEGGTGHDKYYIQGIDTVFDSDMKGSIHFETGITGTSMIVGDLFKKGEVKDQNGDIIKTIWASSDNQITAFNDHQDLIVAYQGNKAIIKNYFQLDAKNHLGITLHSEASTELPEIHADYIIEAEGKYNQINIYNNKVSVQYYGRQTEWDGIGIDLGGDVLMGTGAKQVYAQMSKYDDKVFGSLNADVVYGNDGNDHIYGSQYLSPEKDTRTQEQKDADADYIVGGNGVDLIYGL